MRNKGIWMFIIIFLAALFLISSMMAGIISLFVSGRSTSITSGNVALISINGVISTEKTGAFGDDTISSAEIIENIENSDKAENIKAIIFAINSPGGTPVASDEIAAAIKKVSKTKVAYIREIGTSGAYWIASATDCIFANRMSITGSIGVIASYLEFSGFLSRYNITYQRLVTGKYKDAGSPLKELTSAEEKMIQKQIDLIHGYFIDEVAKNRNLSKEDVEKIATGEFFLGIEAKELGLIDEIGGKEEAVTYIEQELNITAEISEFKKTRTILDLFSEITSYQSFYVGKGIGDSLFDKRASSSVEILT